MSVENLSANKLLVVSGALAVAAGVLFFTLPPDTAYFMAERIGLQATQVGLKVSEPDENTSRDAHSFLFRSRKSAGREGAAEKSSERAPLQLTAANLMAKPEDMGGADSAEASRAALKATSRERGHLVEKYMYVNGRMVLLVDGQVMPNR